MPHLIPRTLRPNKTVLQIKVHKMKKSGLLFLLFLLFSNNVLAQSSTQFNFDEDYEGEEQGIETKESLIYDPLEVINRPIFGFNEFIDKYAILPIVRQYHRFTPDPVRKSVHNFVTNIFSPFSVVNSLLQGNGTNAMASFSSFLINSTLGVGGLFDVAGERKIKYHYEDLGQTLGHYGLSTGPYLVIPFLGPSDLRDFAGFAAERAVDPLSFNLLEVGGQREFITTATSVSLATITAVDLRESLIETVDNIRKDSFDVYATFRSAYLQRRESLIINK